MLVGETPHSDTGTRPDYSVVVANALVGFIEVKAPGKGADPRKFTDPHDKAQWEKLKALPNLLYTDGNSFSRWRNGERDGPIVGLDGDVESAGAKLAAPATLLPLITDFLAWQPDPAEERARTGAGRGAAVPLPARRSDRADGGRGQSAGRTWPRTGATLLFPDADDAQFADGYAQAVTFGLLMARSLKPAARRRSRCGRQEAGANPTR